MWLLLCGFLLCVCVFGFWHLEEWLPYQQNEDTKHHCCPRHHASAYTRDLAQCQASRGIYLTDEEQEPSVF